MYVLDKDGNLVSAADVATILQSAYNSENRDELFRKYGVVGNGPKSSVSYYWPVTFCTLPTHHMFYILPTCDIFPAHDNRSYFSVGVGGGPEVVIHRLVWLRVDVVGDYCLRYSSLHRCYNTHILSLLSLEHVSMKPPAPLPFTTHFLSFSWLLVVLSLREHPIG